MVGDSEKLNMNFCTVVVTVGACGWHFFKFTSSTTGHQSAPLQPSAAGHQMHPRMHPPQPISPPSAHQYNFILSLLARGEVQTLLQPRHNLIHLNNFSNTHLYDKSSSSLDVHGNLVRTYELLECLPQNSRGTLPPEDGFLDIGNELGGDGMNKIGAGMYICS